MIRVTIGNNLKRTNENFTPDTTLRAALEQAGVDFATGMITLDGAVLNPGDLNKTFADLGYDGTEDHNKCQLCVVAKAQNA